MAKPPLSTDARQISVVICTRNRADLLRQAIRSVVEQDFLRSGFELVVVDNGSSDHTQSVVAEFSNQADIVYVLEPQVGLCVARNTAWRTARGEFVAFFDDDALAQEGWLEAIARTIATTGGRFGVAGGRADPIWQAPRPTWLSDKIAGSLTIVDWGATERPIEELQRMWLVGANMVVPRARLDEVGGFHPRLDRYRDKLLSSGDVFLQKRIAERGWPILYVPDIAICHLVPPSRLVKTWFLQRFYWQGISDAVMQAIETEPGRRGRLRAAARRLHRLLRTPARLAALVRSTDDPDQFAQKCFALIDVGFVMEMLGVARR
jgi:glycosyltransferase involved in cell wall biosynthesis